MASKLAIVVAARSALRSSVMHVLVAVLACDHLCAQWTARAEPIDLALTCPQFASVVDLVNADNTGATDTAPALQAAIDSGLSLRFPEGTYKINASLEFASSNAEYCFGGSKFVSDNRITFFRIDGSNLVLRDFEIDALCLPVDTYAMRINKGSKNVSLIRGVVRDIANDEPVGSQYGLLVDLDSTHGTLVDHCVFENISQVEDNTSTNHFCAAIYFATASDAITSATNAVVRDCVVAEVYSPVVASSVSNADGIRFSGIPGDPESLQLDVVLEGNTFLNCQKRTMKVSHVGGVRIIGNHVIDDRTDVDGQAAIEILGESRDISVDDLSVVGNYNTAVWIQSATNVMLNDIRCQYGNTVSSGVVGLGVRIEPFPTNSGWVFEDISVTDHCVTWG